MNTNSPKQEPEQPTPENVQSTATAKPRTVEEFGAWIDAELLKLEDRWLALASPNARRLKFGRKF